MKVINKAFILPTLLIALFISSCTQLVEGLNEDPNNPTSSPFNFVLTGSQVGAVMVHSGETARKANIFSGHMNGIDRQHLGFNQYILSSGDFDRQWDDAFVNLIRNTIVAEDLAIEQGRLGIATGIASVMRALGVGTTASLFGDIPFQDAGRIEIQNPRFQSQREVYNQLQLLLDEAIVQLQSNQGRIPGNTDVFFDGDADRWIRVAHTLKARYFMHTQEYGAAYQSAMRGISSHHGSMIFRHLRAQPGSNLFFQFFSVARPNDMIVSDFFAGMLNPNSPTYRGNTKTNERARFNHYMITNSNGFTVNTNNNGYMASDAPFPLVTFAENLLILAEAGLRSNGFSSGLNHLNQYRAYMNGGGYLNNVSPNNNLVYLPYEPQDFGLAGMANPNNLNQSDAILREILEERYIAFFCQIEGFNDLRRTQDETSVRVRVTPNAGAQLPQRFLYPQSEIDRNPNTPTPIPDLFVRTPVNQ